MKNFWIRTASAAVYAVLFLGSVLSGLWAGQAAGLLILAAFLLFVGEGCAFELYRMSALKGARPNRALGYAATALTVLLAASTAGAPNPLAATHLPVVMLLILLAPAALMAELWRRSEQPFGDVAHTLLPALYAGLPLGLMVVLHRDFNVLVMCILLVWANDCFAYMGGSLFGKHKMWPRHSPGKTWEGTAIGALCCMAMAVLAGPLFDTTLEWFDWVAVGLICSVAGTLGDLAESMIKRSVGVKDSGSIMPGHGGFLDRFDSLLMAVPFVAAYLTARMIAL